VSAFFNMGGYAGYLWPAYAITFGVVVLNIIWARRLLAQARAGARRRLAAQDAMPAQGGSA